MRSDTRIKAMKIKSTIAIFTVTTLVLAACDSTRLLYKSADSKKDYWIVNAFTMSHCGCTQLFVENYKNGRHDFRIMYTDNVARKSIYEYNEKGKITDTLVFVAKANNFKIPFDSLDNEVYRQLRTIVENKEALVYEMKWTDYKGYVKE
jgi:hypothetical protein